MTVRNLSGDSESLKLMALFGLFWACSLLAISIAFGFPNATGVLATFANVFICLAVYFVSGRRVVTPLGIFALASLFFLVLPYVYGMAGVAFVVEWEHNAAALAVLFSTSIATLVSATCTRDARTHSIYRKGVAITPYERKKYVILGTLLLIVGVTVHRFGGLLERFSDGLIFSSFSICLVVGLISLRGRNRVSAAACLLVSAAAVAAYLIVLFGAGGRLRIATFGFCSLIVISCFYRTYVLKLVPLIGAPVFLVWGSVIRTPGLTDVSPLLRLSEARGMSSVLAPFVTLSELIKGLPSLTAGSIVHYQLGATYFYNIIFWIPRAVWESKPGAFGRTLTYWLRPSLDDTTHSMAASYIGEAFANFYIFGIVFAGLVAGLIIVVISKLFHIAVARERAVHSVVFALAVYSLVGGTIADFVWADTNTFTQRGLVRLVVLLGAFNIMRLKFTARRKFGGVKKY